MTTLKQRWDAAVRYLDTRILIPFGFRFIYNDDLDLLFYIISVGCINLLATMLLTCKNMERNWPIPQTIAVISFWLIIALIAAMRRRTRMLLFRAKLNILALEPRRSSATLETMKIQV